jgi:hypothetical protein
MMLPAAGRVFRAPVVRQVLKGCEFLTAPFARILGLFTAFVKHMMMPAVAHRVVRTPVICQVLNGRECLPAPFTIKFFCHIRPPQIDIPHRPAINAKPNGFLNIL